MPALAVAAAVPAVANVAVIGSAPPVALAATVEPDPILAAIAEHRQLYAIWGRASGQRDKAEGKIKEQCPRTLVAWRKYSHVGHSEIERARDEFLALPGANPETIEREHREVRAAVRARRRAERQWYKRNGLADLKAKADGAIKAERKAMWALTRIKPTTTAGAGALGNG